MKFEVGESVLVIRPKNTDAYPSWISNMDKYDKTVQEVNQSQREGLSYLLKGVPYAFSCDWLYPVGELTEAIYGE